MFAPPGRGLYPSGMPFIIANKIATLDKRTLFLLDGMGALLSALLLGGVLPRFPELFGMPQLILHSLALMAFLLALSGLLNALKLFGTRRVLLWMTVVGNAFYIALTASFVILFAAELKPLDFAYFIGEMAIIATLASIEYRAWKLNP